MSELLDKLLTQQQRLEAAAADVVEAAFDAERAGFRHVSGTALMAWHWPQVLEAATVYRDKPTSPFAYRTPLDAERHRDGYLGKVDGSEASLNGLKAYVTDAQDDPDADLERLIAAEKLLAEWEDREDEAAWLRQKREDEDFIAHLPRRL